MNKHRPIEIVRLENGFLVRPSQHGLAEANNFCFETLEALLGFLEKYYSVEGPDLLYDNPKVG